ncbi:MAG: hypothetical protein R3C10_23770 [Pirellulales bacterium]
MKFGEQLGGAELVRSCSQPLPLTDRVEAGEESQIACRRVSQSREIRQLIVKLARENNWGYTGSWASSKTRHHAAITQYRQKCPQKEHNLVRTAAEEGTWDEFLKVHADTLWQCDFYAKRVLTIKGWKELYLLVFLHVGTERTCSSRASTFHPNDAWVIKQADV